MEDRRESSPSMSFLLTTIKEEEFKKIALFEMIIFWYVLL